MLDTTLTTGPVESLEVLSPGEMLPNGRRAVKALTIRSNGDGGIEVVSSRDVEGLELGADEDADEPGGDAAPMTEVAATLERIRQHHKSLPRVRIDTSVGPLWVPISEPPPPETPG